MIVSSSEISLFLGLKVFGKEIIIEKPCSLNKPNENCMMYINTIGNELDSKLRQVPRNCLVFIKQLPNESINNDFSFILTDNPRLSFIKTIHQFFYFPKNYKIEFSDQSNGSYIGKNASLGFNTYIGKNVSIGNNAFIGNNVTITGTVTIGNDCYIKSGVVIGEEGFGFEYDQNGVPIRFPHIGSVHIGNNVFIGSNSTIELASLDETIICDNVKIDDLVQIGHNSFVGKNTTIMAGSIICGSAIIENDCWISPNSTIIQKVTVGNNSLVGLGSVVINNVEINSVVVGNPAKKIRNRFSVL